MPRPRSEEKRSAILDAATRLFVTQGLSAPTMQIAKEAGIPNGSLFTYFPTKADLLNQLYLQLKAELLQAAMNGVKDPDCSEQQIFQVWRNWTGWAVSHPDKRRVLASLNVSEEISSETRAAAHIFMRPLGELLNRCRALGPMKNVSNAFFAALVSAMADSTMEFMSQDPDNAAKHCRDGFTTFWRAVN